jgi:phage repressor protein C with HTH and peptisase S24 domain
VVKTRQGEILAKQLQRQTANRLELLSFNSAHATVEVSLEDIEWMARIIWASQ